MPYTVRSANTADGYQVNAADAPRAARAMRALRGGAPLISNVEGVEKFQFTREKDCVTVRVQPSTKDTFR
jgi:hypothetical protein